MYACLCIHTKTGMHVYICMYPCLRNVYVTDVNFSYIIRSYVALFIFHRQYAHSVSRLEGPMLSYRLNNAVGFRGNCRSSKPGLFSVICCYLVAGHGNYGPSEQPPTGEI